MQYPTVANIDRRHEIPYEQFAEEYLFPNKPVIISGAMELEAVEIGRRIFQDKIKADQSLYRREELHHG